VAGHTALAVYEPDMVGVKGDDAAILKALARHKVWIVSKRSNGNTITHYVKADLKTLRRVEAEIEAAYENAQVSIREIALVSAVGRGPGPLPTPCFRPPAVPRGLRGIRPDRL
jgi:aspartate kinase